MDYSVLAPKPQKKAEKAASPPPPPPPPPTEKLDPPAEKLGPPAAPPAKEPTQIAPQSQGCLQPRFHHHDPYNMGIPMAYVKNVELTNSRTFRMHFRDDPYGCFQDHGHGPPPLRPPPPPPCREKLLEPPPCCIHGPCPLQQSSPCPQPAPGPPPMSAPRPSGQSSTEPTYRPPPPPPPPPPQGYYPAPYYGYFSDENPNGCIVM